MCGWCSRAAAAKTSGAQYSLPDDGLQANRDLDGCRKAILDAVLQAQGKGCGPGILGVCIGGDRATGYEMSKTQFLRRLEDRNPEPKLDALEQDILKTSNELGIGPMGFGGKTTLLGVKICTANRVPASYFRERQLHVLGISASGSDVGWGGENREVVVLILER